MRKPVDRNGPIVISGRQDGEFQYDFEQVDPEDLRDTDIKVECGGIAIYVMETRTTSKGRLLIICRTNTVAGASTWRTRTHFGTTN